MKLKVLWGIAVLAGTLMFSAQNGYSFGSYGSVVDNACGTTVYTGDCALCHTASRSEPTAAKDAYSAGGTTLTDFFCPSPVATCTDSDGDSYAVEGGDCGPVDCNDADAAVNPGATENCSDGFDNNCNDLIDELDPAAVGCQVCTDNDGDGFALEGGSCGPVDCDDNDAGISPDITDIPNNGIDENCDGSDTVDNSIVDSDADGFTVAQGDCDDTDAAVNPDALEICTDAIDNDCDGLVDAQDPDAVECTQTCFDNDGDLYAIDGGNCGPVDCDDNNADTNPGAAEVCDDGIDNDCDGSVDEGCNIDVVCPDADGDGYLDAVCGGTDCNDSNAAINPGAPEITDNGIDENCNGASDDVSLTCADGSVLVVDRMKYKRGRLWIKGRASAGTTVTVINDDTGEVLADGLRTRGSRGVWKTRISELEAAPEWITVMSSDGCSRMLNRVLYEKYKYTENASSCTEESLSVKKSKYKWGKLGIRGRADADTTISVINDDTGEILADNIQPRRSGAWKVVVDGVIPAPASVIVDSSNGCSSFLGQDSSYGQPKVLYDAVTQVNEQDGNGNQEVNQPQDEEDRDDDHDEEDDD
jgi:hypothetical protein